VLFEFRSSIILHYTVRTRHSHTRVFAQLVWYTYVKNSGTPEFLRHILKKKLTNFDSHGDMTISIIIATIITTMSLVLRDLDKIPNDDVCLILFELAQMHQAHLPDHSTATVSFFVLSSSFSLKTNI
jgi:hypothetical protein